MWVFAYGSLIWDQGFPVAESAVARLAHWHRSFCMRSIHHRGTVQAPGLVLALDAKSGAHCDGLALRVQPGAEAATLAALRDRELISSAYLERDLPVTLTDGRVITALAYVIDPAHVQYCALTPTEQASIIATAAGKRGRNRDYLFATTRHLAELGIADPELGALATCVASLPEM